MGTGPIFDLSRAGIENSQRSWDRKSWFRVFGFGLRECLLLENQLVIVVGRFLELRLSDLHSPKNTPFRNFQFRLLFNAEAEKGFPEENSSLLTIAHQLVESHNEVSYAPRQFHQVAIPHGSGVFVNAFVMCEPLLPRGFAL